MNPGGLEPPAAGLKVPCPADPGYVRSGSADPAFARVVHDGPRLFGGWLRKRELVRAASFELAKDRGLSPARLPVPPRPRAGAL